MPSQDAPEETIRYVQIPRDLSCDEQFALSYVGGRIENAILFGLGEPGDCLLPSQELPILIEPYQIGRYWIRVISAKNPKAGIADEAVIFSIASEGGKNLDASHGFVSPLAMSDASGMRQDLEFLFKRIGVFRISIQYADGDTSAVAYSPPIIVVPPGGVVDVRR